MKESLDLDYLCQIEHKMMNSCFQIRIQFTNLVWMIADQNFYDICFTFFILRLRLRPTTKGRSLSGPNIRLRPKVKIAPTVQHCFYGAKLIFWPFATFIGKTMPSITTFLSPVPFYSSQAQKKLQFISQANLVLHSTLQMITGKQQTN